MTPTIQQQVACLEREVRMRERVYPRWVQAGKMTQPKADAETETMRAALETLRTLVPPAAQGSLLP
jgi:hypothetical protein